MNWKNEKEWFHFPPQTYTQRYMSFTGPHYGEPSRSHMYQNKVQKLDYKSNNFEMPGGAGPREAPA